MRVVLYARVSSMSQDVDLSISAQLKALRDYARRSGHVMVKEFIDEAETGKTTARPAFREMIALSRRHPRPFEAILVWKYSRFARDRGDSIFFKTMLRKNGIRVISVTEPLENTPSGKLFEAFIESMDEYYSLNLGEEVSRGLRESASRGFYVSSSAPYGYRRVMVKDGAKERPKLDPDPSHAETVAFAFRSVTEGKGLKEILKELNEKGIAGPRRKGWSKSTLHKILTNEVYTGVLVWGRNSTRDLPSIRVENAWTAIIDRSTFDLVQKILSERAPANLHPKRTASRYLLSGLAKCGHCGKALVGQDAKSGKFSYYVCDTLLKKGAGMCPTHYLNTKKFENLVVDKIKHDILTEENLTDMVRLVNEELGNEATGAKYQLEVVATEIAEVDRRLDALYDALETRKIGLDDLAPRIQQLRLRHEQLDSTRRQMEERLSDRRVEIADLSAVTKCVQNLRNLVEETSMAEKRTFIRSFVKEVRVNGDKATLIYTFPLLPKGNGREEGAVLSTVHYGGAGGIRTPYLLTASQTFSQMNYSPAGTCTI